MARVNTGELDHSFTEQDAKAFVEFLDSVGFAATTKPLAGHPHWIRVSVGGKHTGRVTDILIGWIAGRRIR